MSYLGDFRRLAGLREAKPSNLAGITLKVRRAGGRTAFDLMAATDVSLTDYEKNWSVAPENFRPNQFARVEVEKMLLELDRVSETGAAAKSVWDEGPTPFAAKVSALKTKSTPSKRYPELAWVYSTRGAVVGGDFQGQGYGAALFLKALEWATDKGFWLVSDFKGSDTDAGQGAWRALFRFAQHHYEGSYWTTVLPPQTSHPFFAAYGLNAAGKKALAAMASQG